MLQFYFLSVALNVGSGFALYSVNLDKKRPNSIGTLVSLAGITADPTLRMLLGTLSILTGFFKLLSVAPGDVPVVGDIIPAIIGIALGLVLLLDTYHVKRGVDSRLSGRLEKLILKYKPILGLLGIAVGLIHFLFPSVLLI
jgi:hypothetical protein